MKPGNKRLVAPLLLILIVGSGVPSLAAEKSENKIYCEPTPDQSVLYFIRPADMMGFARTLFIYADDQLLGTLDNNSYTCVRLDPGRYLLWPKQGDSVLNLEAGPGQVYYFEATFGIGFSWLPESEREASLQEVKFYATATDKELAKAAEHVAKRLPKVQKLAQERAVNREKRLQTWPAVDLSSYSTLYIDDFQITDRKALKPKNVEAARSATERMAALVKGELDSGPFAAVHQGAAGEQPEASLLLKVEVVKFRPGKLGGAPPPQPGFSITVSMEMATLRFGFKVELVDATSGEVLAAFADERGPGMPYNIERNVPLDLVSYLRASTGAG